MRSQSSLRTRRCQLPQRSYAQLRNDVYWISAHTPCSVAEWQLYADGLKTLAMHHGLKCDYGLTIDSARVLRVPETYNHKTNSAKASRAQAAWSQPQLRDGPFPRLM